MKPIWIAKANKYIGVKEDPCGSNWGGQVRIWIENQGFEVPVYWCAIFVSQIFVESEINNKKLYSARAIDFSKNNKSYKIADVIYGRYKAKAGDLLVRSNHVNFLAEWYGEKGKTIGGNESNMVRKADIDIEKMINKRVKYITDVKGLLNE